VKEFCSLIHRPLEGFASGNHSGAAGSLVDDSCLDGILKVMRSGGSARIDETGASHVAVDDLVAAEVDRMIGGQFCVDALVELTIAGVA